MPARSPLSRTSVFTEPVIRDMTRLSLVHGAINLAQGFLDFAAPEPLKEAAVAAIRADFNQYAITWGARPLRDAIASEPFYENYAPDAAMCGANLVFVPLDGPGFTFDRSRLRAAFSPRTKAVIVNTPHNHLLT